MTFPIFLFFLLTMSLHAQADSGQSALEEKGREVFRACDGCHNTLTDARKAAPSLRTLFGKVRLINGKRTTDDNVVQLVKDGYNRMPSYQYILRPQDWEQLLAFLKTLRARPEIGATLQPIRGTDQEVLAAGKKIYEQECASCHSGPEAKAAEILSVYKRETLASGDPVHESAFVRLAREGHGGMPGKPDTFDDAAIFTLIAFLKAQ